MLYELSFSYPHSQHTTLAVKHALRATCGIKSSDIVESRTGGTVRLAHYCADSLLARTIRALVASELPKGIKLHLRRLADNDWKTKWKRDFKPFALTPELRVVPAWLKDRDRHPSNKHLYIDTSMAFGTGMHPTTRAMAGFITLFAPGCRDFLDLGTGTGILTLVAHRCGIRDLWAMDISEDAVKTARRNFQLNRCSGVTLYQSDIGDLPGVHAFDFVAANILVPVLLANREGILARVRAGGLIAVSGIWHKDEHRFMRRFEGPELTRLKTRRSGGWVSILYRKVRAPFRMRRPAGRPSLG